MFSPAAGTKSHHCTYPFDGGLVFDTISLNISSFLFIYQTYPNEPTRRSCRHVWRKVKDQNFSLLADRRLLIL